MGNVNKISFIYVFLTSIVIYVLINRSLEISKSSNVNEKISKDTYINKRVSRRDTYVNKEQLESHIISGPIAETVVANKTINLLQDFYRYLTINDTVNLLKLIDFNCTKMVTKTNLEFQKLIKIPEKLNDMNLVLADIVEGRLELIEGNAALFPGQKALYVRMSRQPWVRRVCETGFNAGHSTLFWLAASNLTEVLSFDIARWNYTKLMAAYMQAKYPNRIKFVWGDSKTTINQFRQNITAVYNAPLNETFSCDVIIIDGGHDYNTAISDIRKMRNFANPLHHIIIIDDYNLLSVRRAVAKVQKKQLIKKISACSAYPDIDRGMVFAQYT